MCWELQLICVLCMLCVGVEAVKSIDSMSRFSYTLTVQLLRELFIRRKPIRTKKSKNDNSCKMQETLNFL